MGEVVQIRDYQNKRDLDRLKDQTLEMQACDPGPCFGAGIDGMQFPSVFDRPFNPQIDYAAHGPFPSEYIAPEKDPA